MPRKIKDIRISLKMTQKAFSEMLHIPKRTLQDWEGEKRHAPEYLIELIEFRIKNDTDIKKERE